MCEQEQFPWEQLDQVSLWLGQFDNEKQLKEYVSFVYQEDVVVKPKFCNDFLIDFFDEDFMESFMEELPSNDLLDLLVGCSYDDVIIPKYKELMMKGFNLKANAAILLFNFKYHEKVLENTNNNNCIKYIGTVKYK